MITRFRPNDLITRAEFSAVLSRYLYGNAYEGATGPLRYEKHLNALHDAGYIKNIATPQANELRGYLLLILYRIAHPSK